MIELYTWPTPNGHKIHIMLEEVGLPYEVRPVDINLGDQFHPDFLARSARTTGFRRSSTRTARAASRSRSSSPARS